MFCVGVCEDDLSGFQPLQHPVELRIVLQMQVKGRS